MSTCKILESTPKVIVLSLNKFMIKLIFLQLKCNVFEIKLHKELRNINGFKPLK